MGGTAPDEQRLPGYLQARAELQHVFPGVFLAMRSAVENELSEFGARGVVGELDRETSLGRNPEAGLNAPYDWVAFGFGGFEFYDAHVGVVMDTRAWPCTCHVGFHRRSHLPAVLHEQVAAIDWVTAVGSEPTHVVIEDTGEHQLRDEARPFDFSAIESETAHFAARAVAYYRAAAPLLASVTSG